MRCFIAIPLPEYIHKQLAQIQSQLKETGADVKWVNSGNIHLTLKFLGEVEEAKSKTISEELKKISCKHTNFKTCAGELGTFPTLSNPRVIWIGINKNEDKIIKLQKGIEEVFQSLDFEKETRPFHPHLTLGRVRDKKNIQSLIQKIKSSLSLQDNCFAADKIVLLKSALKPQGAEYTTIDEFKLKVDPVRDLKNAK